MIVKDESHVILQTLKNLCSLIEFDYWIVADTGSTDGTQDLIREFFNNKRINGEIHQREWKNFGFNRTEAFKLAEFKSDYVFVFDADDLLHGEISFPEKLDKNFYLLRFGDEFVYWRPLLFKNNLDWRFRGVLHEYANSPFAGLPENLEGNYTVESRRLGDRNKDFKAKFEKDVRVLEEALKEEPDNERYLFYLGQSYKDAGIFDKAIEVYDKRIALGAWPEECYFAFFQKAICHKALGNWPEAEKTFLEAYTYRPQRIEPLFEIGQYYKSIDNFALGYLYLSLAAKQKTTEDSLFVSSDIYEWRALDELSICAYYIGNRKEAMEISCELLECRNFPEEQRIRLESNRLFGVASSAEKLEEYPERDVNFLKLKFNPEEVRI